MTHWPQVQPYGAAERAQWPEGLRHLPKGNAMKASSPSPYEPKFTPHADMVRDVKVAGAWFEVGIDCMEPDEAGVIVHPENYWVECVKLGGAWWGADDVLSAGMRQCLDKALQSAIATEYAESLKP